METINLNSDVRLYVQMAPDEAGVREFERIGDALAPQKSGRLLPPEEIHLTLIHFGKPHDVLASFRKTCAVRDGEFRANLEDYVERTRAVMTDESYELSPTRYDRFGARGTTLVARYEAPESLKKVHAAAYAELLRFIGACGISNAGDFTAHDHNLMYAQTFSPHITIYKGYDGDLPEAPLPQITVSFMPLVY